MVTGIAPFAEKYYGGDQKFMKSTNNKKEPKIYLPDIKEINFIYNLAELRETVRNQLNYPDKIPKYSLSSIDYKKET